jgi:hypothetical protein
LSPSGRVTCAEVTAVPPLEITADSEAFTEVVLTAQSRCLVDAAPVGYRRIGIADLGLRVGDPELATRLNRFGARCLPTAKTSQLSASMKAN